MLDKRTEVILVDKRDYPIGKMEKLAAHITGQLHRAFSIFIFNSKGEMLLQRRAQDKYHSAGQWTNACCSHPIPGEETMAAAHDRLKYEMGLETKLFYNFTFQYHANVNGELIENEIDHVYTGMSDLEPVPNPKEVMDYTYLSPIEIFDWIDREPDSFTPWFKICFPQLIKHIYN